MICNLILTLTIHYLTGATDTRTKWANDFAAMQLKVIAVDPEFLKEMKLKKIEVSEEEVPEFICEKGPVRGKIKK